MKTRIPILVIGLLSACQSTPESKRWTDQRSAPQPVHGQPPAQLEDHTPEVLRPRYDVRRSEGAYDGHVQYVIDGNILENVSDRGGIMFADLGFARSEKPGATPGPIEDLILTVTYWGGSWVFVPASEVLHLLIDGQPLDLPQGIAPPGRDVGPDGSIYEFIHFPIDAALVRRIADAKSVKMKLWVCGERAFTTHSSDYFRRTVSDFLLSN